MNGIVGLLIHNKIMDKKKKKEKIIHDIEVLEDIIVRLNTEKDIPEIEIDIVLDKLRNLYEEFLLLKKAGKQESNANIEVEKIVEEEKPVEEIRVIEKVQAVEKEVIVEKIEPVEETKVVEEVEIPEVKEEIPVVERPEPVAFEKVIPEEKKSEKKVERFLLEDELTDELLPKKETKKKLTTEENLAREINQNGKISLNEKILAQNPKTDINEGIVKTPLKDIRDGIGLNDRFTYIKELFNGDVNKFNETLVNINGSRNKPEAYSFIKNNFDWKNEDPTYKDFSELVERRFL